MARPTNHQLAAEFLALERYKGKIAFVDALDSFVISDDRRVYRMIESRDFRKEIYRFIVTAYPNLATTNSLICDVEKFIFYACPRRVRTVAWRYLAFNDCVIDMSEGFHELPFDDRMIPLFGIPIDYADLKKAECPTFLRYLESTFVRKGKKDVDAGLVKVVQEMMGNILLPSMEAASAFFLTGEGQNGKSVMLDVLRAMVGKDYCTALSIEALTTNRFASSSLVGKRLNVCAEEESKYLRSDKFKALVSGDMTTAERKYGGTFEFQPQAKFVFATNNAPTFDGLSWGLKRRIKIIPFHRRFTKDARDPKIAKKIVAELPGVIAWALEGARRLVDNGYEFSLDASPAIQEEIENFENETSSALRYFREKWRISSQGFVSNEEMYREYRAWCADNGCRPLGSLNFHKDLVRNIPELALIRAKVDGEVFRGKRVSRRTEEVAEGEEVQEYVSPEKVFPAPLPNF